MTAELRHRGMMVNCKRVLRMMQEDNLLAIRRRKFVSTTDSGHSLRDVSEFSEADGAHCAKPTQGIDVVLLG